MATAKPRSEVALPPRGGALAATMLLVALLGVFGIDFAAPSAYAETIGPDASGITYETASVTVDGVATNTATVTDYSGPDAVDIPSSITEDGIVYAVTAIGDGALRSKGLVSVTIPNSVTTLGMVSFANNSLTEVVIPDSVTAIGNGAFLINNLNSVVLSNSVVTIGEHAFQENSLGSVVIPSSMTVIGNQAFSDSGLRSVTIPNSVTALGDNAFSGNFLESVTIPASVLTIGDNAFSWNSLESVAIPNSVTAISPGAFAKNSLSSITISDSVTSIGASAFESNNLTWVMIPRSVTTIGPRAFGSNLDLTAVVFQGVPPATFTGASDNGSLGHSIHVGGGQIVYKAVVYYPPQYAADYLEDDPGSFAPRWKGYRLAPGVTLGFDLGGHGAVIDSVTVARGVASPSDIEPVAPTATGFTFIGWFAASTGVTPFDFSAPLVADTTAFAQWTAMSEPIDTTEPTEPTAALSDTGIDSGPAVVAGLLALLGGAVALMWTRRRQLRR